MSSHKYQRQPVSCTKNQPIRILYCENNTWFKRSGFVGSPLFSFPFARRISLQEAIFAYAREVRSLYYP